MEIGRDLFGIRCLFVKVSPLAGLGHFKQFRDRFMARHRHIWVLLNFINIILMILYENQYSF